MVEDFTRALPVTWQDLEYFVGDSYLVTLISDGSN